MREDAEFEFNTDSEVTLPDDAKDATRIEVTPELLRMAMASGQMPRLPRGSNYHNRCTKLDIPRAKRRRLRKLQQAARAASRGTTSSRKGQRVRMNNSAAK